MDCLYLKEIIVYHLIIKHAIKIMDNYVTYKIIKLVVKFFWILQAVLPLTIIIAIILIKIFVSLLMVIIATL